MSYKRWLFIALFLFVIGLVLGAVTKTGIATLFAGDVAALEELAEQLSPLPRSSIFAFVFVKNVSALLISFALSPIFCLAPVIALILNGGILGLVSVLVIEEESAGYLLAGLLPHGIFELPAFIIGEAAALSFGTAVILALFRKERRKRLLPNLGQNLRYLAVALVLLLPAAIIETYITPLFLG